MVNNSLPRIEPSGMLRIFPVEYFIVEPACRAGVQFLFGFLKRLQSLPNLMKSFIVASLGIEPRSRV